MHSIKTKQFSDCDNMTADQTNKVVDFLHTHLEQFRDDKEDIQKAIDYAMGNNESPGGFVLTCFEAEEMAGAVIINKTAMGGYIPENILVYIAVHSDFRGKGIGKKLIGQLIKIGQDLNLTNLFLFTGKHRTAANKLYTRIGFTKKNSNLYSLKISTY